MTEAARAGAGSFFSPAAKVDAIDPRIIATKSPPEILFFRRSGGKPRLQAPPLCADIGNSAGRETPRGKILSLFASPRLLHLFSRTRAGLLSDFPRRFQKIPDAAAGRATLREKISSPFAQTPSSPYLCVKSVLSLLLLDCLLSRRGLRVNGAHSAGPLGPRH